MIGKQASDYEYEDYARYALWSTGHSPDEDSTVPVPSMCGNNRGEEEPKQNGVRSMQATAIDEKGHVFNKTVEWDETPDGKMVISFGWPAAYSPEDLRKDYPYTKGLCIDAMGRNHKGSAVWIQAREMNRILETLHVVEVTDGNLHT